MKYAWLRTTNAPGIDGAPPLLPNGFGREHWPRSTAGFLPDNRDRSDRILVERLASYGATVVTGAVAGTSVSDVGESSPDRFTSTTISTTTATMATMAAITVPNPPLFCVT